MPYNATAVLSVLYFPFSEATPKYRIYCGRSSECVVRYDNESGKGDHRHYSEREEAYRFVSLTRLIEDFKQDCARQAGWRWEE